MNPFTMIERLIEEHGSSTIQGKHLALLREELAVRDRKSTELESKVAQLEAANAGLKAKLDALTSAGPRGDKCPYCQQEKGQLKRIGPHTASLLRQAGHKLGFYECAGCGQNYDKPIRP